MLWWQWVFYHFTSTTKKLFVRCDIPDNLFWSWQLLWCLSSMTCNSLCFIRPDSDLHTDRRDLPERGVGSLFYFWDAFCFCFYELSLGLKQSVRNAVSLSCTCSCSWTLSGRYSQQPPPLSAYSTYRHVRMVLSMTYRPCLCQFLEWGPWRRRCCLPSWRP